MKGLFAVIILIQTYVNADIVVTKAERSIDLASQLVKISTQLTLKNEGNAVNEVNFAVEEEQNKYLSFIEAANKKDEETKLALTHSKSGKGQLYTIALGSTLNKDASITLVVETVFSHKLEPFPTKIGQSEKQQVVYIGNTYVFSPYVVKEQKNNCQIVFIYH